MEESESPDGGARSGERELDPSARMRGAVDGASRSVLRDARTRAVAVAAAAEEFGELFPRTETPHAYVVSSVLRAELGTLTVLVGPEAGATCTLEHEVTVLGRDEGADIVLDDPTVSRVHARVTRSGERQHIIEDLGSTNGTFVAGRRIRRASLATGDRVQLGRDSLFRFAVLDAEEHELQRRLYEASMRDMLTELPNRRSLIHRLTGEVAHAVRSGRELALLMIDVDHFKSVNDELGHLAGDKVLRAIAQVGAATVRAGDVFARYGGEEFVVLARETGKLEAVALAERLRAAVMAARVDLGHHVAQVTVCVGVAVLSECEAAEGHDLSTSLLARADARLYAAKRSGRNRTWHD
jgi:diguanylate cyclase (GGDEF)-like protein